MDILYILSDTPGQHFPVARDPGSSVPPTMPTAGELNSRGILLQTYGNFFPLVRAAKPLNMCSESSESSLLEMFKFLHALLPSKSLVTLKHTPYICPK